MVRIVRESDSAGVPVTAKKHALSEQTLYVWRKKFGSLEATDVRRLKHLEQEHGRLKKIVAERDLELDVMKEINRKKMVSAQGRRLQVSFAKGRELSVRRACALVGVARSCMGYQPKMPAKDAPVLTVMRTLSS